MSAWELNTGAMPNTGGKKILVRLACRTREDVERAGNAQEPNYWKRWTLDGQAGDIVEYRLI